MTEEIILKLIDVSPTIAILLILGLRMEWRLGLIIDRLIEICANDED